MNDTGPTLTPASRVRGRFAPTPSGPLHKGSLRAAVASWLSAKCQGGEWWLRIDDLDRARCPPGAEALILKQLEAYGLHWDGAPLRQSEHLGRYRAAFEALQRQELIYPCTCTRKAVRDRQQLQGAPGYDQYCWAHPPDAPRHAAWRLALDDRLLHWFDDFQGPRTAPRNSLGDPVVWRRDGLPGYPLACMLDEVHMGITEVVRGADLITETHAQVQIARQLGLALPLYRHITVVRGVDGRKLSKQNHAPALPLSAKGRAQTMAATLTGLIGDLSESLITMPPNRQLDYALQHLRERHNPTAT